MTTDLSLLKIPACEVVMGDLVDLEGDPYVDKIISDDEDRDYFRDQLMEVLETDTSSPFGADQVYISFDGVWTIVSFPASHPLAVDPDRHVQMLAEEAAETRGFLIELTEIYDRLTDESPTNKTEILANPR